VDVLEAKVRKSSNITMSDYVLDTKKNWLQTKQQLANEFSKWGVTDWILTPPNQTIVTVRYVLGDREIVLTSDKQASPKDNLRVVWMTVQSLRLNELRGMSEIFTSAYMQIGAPILEKDPWDVLGLPRGTAISVCEAQFKVLAKKNHPDLGGDAVKFKELNDAIEKIRSNNGN